MRLFAALLLLISLSANAQITGKWTASTQNEQMSLALNADGTGVLDGERLKYTTQSGVMTVNIIGEQESHNYNYNLNGNTLTVSGGDLNEPIVFTRVGPNNQNPQSSASGNNSLIGLWYGNGEQMEFKADGTCLYANASFKYTAENGQLKLSMPEGLVVIPYQLKNGTLIINVEGNDYSYTKSSSAQGAQHRNQQPKTPVISGSKNVPQELVGKWCWVDVTNTNSGGTSSDACITLNADGSYEFYSERSMSATNQAFSAGTNSATSDRGTWWVQGQRIYYNSDARGPGSYSLQKRNHPKNVNDPMIVLDGQPFVTQYQKAPWR